MSKIQLLLFALLLFQFACEPDEDTLPGTDYDQVTDGFEDMFKGALSMTGTLPLISVIDRTKDRLKVKIEVENISQVAGNYFDGYVGNAQALNRRVFYPAPPYSSKLSNENATRTLDNVIDTSRIFNGMQKVYIKSLNKDIAAAEDYADGFAVVSSFRNQVVHATELTGEEKILLLEIAAGSEAFLEFVENGGIQEIRSNLSGAFGNDIPFGRVADCSVDWRGVWTDGVLNLIGGAAIGGLTGAIAGSFTIPFIGTVYGGVNGAVIGGAIGFTSGVLYGIAGDLVTSCSRTANSTLQQTYASCEEAWEAFLTYETDTMPTDCFVVDVSI